MLFTIEKLIYGGEGLARLPQDERGPGKSVFVPFVLEGERVEAELVEEKPGFARARLTRILEPSSQRIAPGCPYFADCGGCQYQHTDYDNQLRIKQRILRETFLRIAKLDLPAKVEVHASPAWNYRNRTRMRVQVGGDFVLGYNRFRSVEILPVRECPISSPLINRAIPALWDLGERGLVPSDVREIEWFANERDEALLVEVTAEASPGEKRGVSPAWKEFARGLREALQEIAGIAVFEEIRRGSATQRQQRQLHDKDFGERDLLYQTAAGEYRVSAGSFFQTNRFLTDELLRVVTSDLSGQRALDLYAGVGLFSLALARTFEQVTAVELAASSFADLKRNVPANVSARRAAAEEFLSRLPKQASYDCVIVDPPRAGLGERVARKVGSLGAQTIVYVSCDPSTQARDVRILLDAGYRIERAHLLDLFPQTFHMESVLRLRR
jgi:23S rRNA (uracil1939-C5)-methyltransferase